MLYKSYNQKKKTKKTTLPEYIKKRLSADIGITTANCPYCGIKLSTFPSRKTKCKKCDNFIYKKTRAYDNANILIKENEIEKVEKEYKKRTFMLNYACDNFEEYEKKLQRIRKTQSIPFNDVIWYKYEQEYREACNKLNFDKITWFHWNKATFLLAEEHYKSALQEYLVFIFWNTCGGNNFVERPVIDKKFEDNYLKTNINFLGNPGRCLEYLNISEKELKKMILNMPIEQGIPFPFSIEELIPYYLKAYKQHKLEKKKFESEYNIHYLIGGKIKNN